MRAQFISHGATCAHRIYHFPGRTQRKLQKVLHNHNRRFGMNRHALLALHFAAIRLLERFWRIFLPHQKTQSKSRPQLVLHQVLFERSHRVILSPELIAQQFLPTGRSGHGASGASLPLILKRRVIALSESNSHYTSFCTRTLMTPGHRFALDLVEVFFQIVHARLPFLNPTQFRERLQSQIPASSTTQNTAFAASQSTASPGQSQFGASSYASTSTAPFPSSSAYHGASGQYAGATPAAAFHAAAYSKTKTHPLESHPALIAVVIAWGAKFSEHPLLVADRNASGPDKQSGLARTLIDRAREIAEGFKVHRIPKVEHVVITLMTESLQSRT